MLELRRTDESDSDFLGLVALLDEELAIRDGAEHGFYAQFNKPVGLGGVVVAYLGGRPLGCGAFKHYEADTAELKRMFVDAASRGQRIGGAILEELEKMAAESGFTSFLLETGHKQPEAIALYKRSGYEVIPNYGQYAGVANSLCMRKESLNLR